MVNYKLDELQAGIKIAGRNINNLRHADDTTRVGESEEELKSRLMKRQTLGVSSSLEVLQALLPAIAQTTSCPSDLSTLDINKMTLRMIIMVTSKQDWKPKIKLLQVLFLLSSLFLMC
ncbi:hypothetical protein AB1E18_015319 [Capra hircus]